jgi:Flp pilus assembly protein CpaB
MVTGRRRPFGRLSTGHWVVLLAGLVAVVLNYAFLKSQSHEVEVALSAVDLPAGSFLDPSTVQFTPIHADESVRATLLTREDLASREGSILAHTVFAGALLSKGDFIVSGDGLRAMSLSIDRDRAVGGLLKRGDTIDVVVSEAGTARYVLVGAEVLSVSDSSGALGSGYSVTIALDADAALTVAAAMSEGTIQLIRSTGADPPASMTYPPEQ